MVKRSYSAKDDSGKLYVVYVYADKWMPCGVFGQPTKEMPHDILKCETHDGKELERLERGKYRIEESGVLITCTSPESW